MDRWSSGRWHRTRNAASLQGLRGFESHPVRHKKGTPCGSLFYGASGSVNAPMFDKIADRQFWARGAAERSERSEDHGYALTHIRGNPTLSANFHVSGLCPLTINQSLCCSDDWWD
jgi:hypothetical protein